MEKVVEINEEETKKKAFNFKQHSMYDAFFIMVLDLLDNGINSTDFLLINYSQENRSLLFEALRKFHEASGILVEAMHLVNQVDFSDHLYAKPKNKREALRSIKQSIKRLSEDFEEDFEEILRDDDE